ncbi:MAG: serine/threonine protein kinase [Candidatus Hydrogenedentes bacterium]|nr:serine/threonine protein kinase [Candidatus Hydrogenedentota bacterium]
MVQRSDEEMDAPNTEAPSGAPDSDDFDSEFGAFNDAEILRRLRAASPPSRVVLTPDQRSVDLRPGSLINRRFKVLKQLGFGGMGAVYLVRDMHLHELRALKVLLPRLLSNPEAQRRFLIETKICQKLSHEHIVRVHDLGVDFETGMQFFTMALADGETLFQYLKRQGGQLPLAEVIGLMKQLCQALAYAHRHTIHRDLKPQNIMRGPDGRITILDFGLAKLIDPNNPALSRMAVGTAHYQAPEQRSDPQGIDRRADLYAAGIILYQLLTGQIPAGQYMPASRVARGVPRSVDAIVRRCLKPREERYASAEELLADLESVRPPGLRDWLLRIAGR